MRNNQKILPRELRAAARRAAGIASLMLALQGTGATAQEADVEALLAAAKQEKPINVYDSTGKIVEIANAFSKKYGLKATGMKVSANSQLEMIIREGRANNVQGDVVLITDAPAAFAQLVPQGFVESWVPPSMTTKIPAQFQKPLAISTNANVWAYNTEVYKNCPIKNMWELTDPKWKGKVAFVDPLTKGSYTDWFNQMAKHADDKVAAAYKEHFGKELKTSEASATAAWLKAFASNGPLVTDGDDPISEAVGAPGQKAPFFGLMSSAKFRDNLDKGYKLGLCTEIKPWVGWTYVKLGLIAQKTKSPNTAKLFIHYLLTPEGIGPQMEDGKIPTNADIKLPKDEPSGIANVTDRLFQYDASSGLSDWDTRQDWQDFWRINYKK
ncbi:ABC transporter substrate-binding protein [Microvirga rosea]|uniref:ABC transporter substrate-binding protein n=1 Tax=Microvirga rosea TaxID=2715425 RepID=UPI00387364DA